LNKKGVQKMKSIIKILIACMAVILVMTGCEYDVAQPMWEKDHEATPVPVISGIEPAGGAGYVKFGS
jgi:hypothetical protein